MKVNQLAVFVSMFILLSACATTKSPTNVTPVAVVPVAPDTSDPTLPITLIPLEVEVIVREKPAEIEVEPLHERGSVGSVSKKMKSHPGTLYWSGKDTYSFYVGGILSAEYKSGEGLRIQEVKGDDSGIVCQFDEKEAGVQQNPECSQLMLTLDAELDD